MATIVNARDQILQAYSPRVATTSMSSNLVVSQDQVTGLGLVIDGTKMAFLSATTQVFQIAKSGTVSPATTVITAELKNLTNTPTLIVVSGTVTPVPALVGGVVTIPYADLKTDAATIRLTVVQDGKTYTDEVTIVKVREGIDGLIGFITNESHTLSSDYLGNVLAYTGASGEFKVFQGVNDITSLCSFSIPAGGNTNALTATINATTGAYSVTGGYPTNTDLAVLLLRAKFGTTILDKVFTVPKTKAGVPGAKGTDGVGVDGKRGSRTFYVTLTGATAAFSNSLATTTATADGGPVMNDIVTQYNTSQGFSQTKFYTAGGWVVVNAVVDGNLIASGTIGAAAMQANLMSADNVLTRGLTVRDINGNIILSSGQNLDYTNVGGTKPPSDATNGATWGTNLSSVPTNVAGLTGSEQILNSDIVIGGRNLVRGGDFSTLMTLYTNNGSYCLGNEIISAGGVDGGPFQRITYSNHESQMGVVTANSAFKPNETYTLSIYTKTSDMGDQYPGGLGLRWNVGPVSLTAVKNPNVAAFWQQHVFTFTMSANPEARTHITIVEGPGAGNIEFDYLKIEVGNKATDWTLAPEDVSADATAKADAALAAAQTYSVAQKELAVTESKSYADGIVTPAEARAIAAAQTKADAAQAAAIAAAGIAGIQVNLSNAPIAILNSEIVVGGRNLYTNTLVIGSEAPGTSVVARSVSGFTLLGIAANTGISRLSGIIPKNGVYTISFDLAVEFANGYPMVVDFCDISPSWTINPTTTVQHFSRTFTIGNYSSIFNFIDLNQLSGQKYTFTNFKVESGNVATDWTPAPEDVSADATAKANAAQTSAVGAAATAAQAKADLAETTAKAYADGIVSSSESVLIADATNKASSAQAAAIAAAALDATTKANAAQSAAVLASVSNMTNLSFWKRDGAIAWPTNGEYNRLVDSVGDVGGVLGPRGGSDTVWYCEEIASNGENGGGWNDGTHAPLDTTKTYRFAIPIYRRDGAGQSYWGIGDYNVCNLNTSDPVGNPYFASASLAPGAWYLFVGFVYPVGSVGHTHESAGVWNCATGEKITGGVNYTQRADYQPGHRAYQYYASSRASQLFGRPLINQVDGTEPSLLEYFGSSALLNSVAIAAAATDATSKANVAATTANTYSDALQGKGKWLAKRYSTPGPGIPTHAVIAKEALKNTLVVDDALVFSWSTYLGAEQDNYIGYISCYVYFNVDSNWTVSVDHDDAGCMYVNGQKIYEREVCCQLSAVVMPFKKGWNTVECMFNEAAGGDHWTFASLLSSAPGYSHQYATSNITNVTLGALNAAASTADWGAVTSRPANVAALTGTEGIKNTAISLSSTGTLSGAGGGTIQTIAVIDRDREIDRPPSFYPTGTTKEFKTASAFVGLGGTDMFFTLETIIQYKDATGGAAYQYAYRGNQTWRRTGVGSGASWAGAWVQDLDRNAYTGDLNATLGTDAATTLGLNPSFEAWTGIYPDGWGVWGDATISKEVGTVRFGSNAARFVSSGSDNGLVRLVPFTIPLPAGSFVSGTLDVYLSAVVSGKPGMLVRLFTDAAMNAFVDTKVQPTSSATGNWQRVPFSARVGAAQQIYGIRIYIMGSWSGMTSGSFTGAVIFDGLTLSIFDASVDNKAITLSSNGALSGGGGGSVTIGGLGYTGALDANKTTNTNQLTDGAGLGTTASWTGVANRPQDVSNLLLKGHFEDGAKGTWTSAYAVEGPQPAPCPHTKALISNARDCVEDNPIRVTPGDVIYVSTWMDTSATVYACTFGYRCHDTAGTVVTFLSGAGQAKGVGWTQVSATITVPVGVVVIYPWLQIDGPNDATTGYVRVAGMWMGRHQPGATVGATWGTNVGSIPANVATAGASSTVSLLNNAITVVGGVLTGTGTAGVVVDNNQIVVGGRNLLTNSKEMVGSGWAATAPFATGQTDPRGGTAAVLISAVTNETYLLKNTQGAFTALGLHTLSVWLKGNKAGVVNIQTQDQAIKLSCTLTTAWQKFTVTGNVTTLTPYYSLVIGGWNSWADLTLQVYAAFPKLEEGNKATDWTPAPEDVSAGIATAGTTANYGNLSGTPSTAIANTSVSLSAAGVLSGGGGGTVTLPGIGLKTFRVAAYGANATAAPVGAGFYDIATGTMLHAGAPMYAVVKVKRSTGVSTFVGGWNTLAGVAYSTDMATALNAIGSDYIVAIYTYDEPQGNRLAGGLAEAMYRHGASRAVYGSSNFQYRSAYVLVGIGGCGEGNGAEVYQGAISHDPNAWVDMSFSVVNGNMVGVSSTSTPKSLTDYGYVGTMNATTNQTDTTTNNAIGAAGKTADWVNISGQTNAPANNASSDITLVGRNVTISGNTLKKTAGVNWAWDADAYSRDSYTGGAYASAVVDTVVSYVMFGLNTDPAADSSYASIDYAFYAVTGDLMAYESNVTSGVIGSYVAGDVLAVTYDGSNIRYMKNGAVLRTVAAVITAPLFFDSAFHVANTSLSNVRFGPMSSNAWGSVGSKPSNVASLNGSESILNSSIVISNTGALSGGASGQMTTLPTMDNDREGNPAPNAYPIGTTKQFKRATAIGLLQSDGYWATLETIIQYGAGQGGYPGYQYCYQEAKTWRRRSANDAGTSWTAWVQDLDTAAYTGALNATYGATFGSNISGKITSDNATTFITDAAIKNAQIGTLDAQKINTGYLSADRLQAGVITADKLNIGSGRNLIRNSTWLDRDATQGTGGGCPKDWRIDYNAVNPLFIAQPGGGHVDWNVIGMYGMDMQQGSGWASGPDSVMIVSTRVPVEAGRRYEFSMYTGAHRCRIYTSTEWLNANGQVVWSSADNATVNDEERSGGKALALFKQIGHFGWAPSGAVEAKFIIVKGATKNVASYTDSHAFCVAPMIAEASANQTVFSSYSPSGLGTKITGSGIDTPSLSAISATVGLLRTTSTGERVEISSDGIRVYGSNNVVRVRLGNLG